jgi:hypothetical protein
MKKWLFMVAVFGYQAASAQEFTGCVKPSILPAQCKNMKTFNDVESCRFMILIDDGEWHSWQECSIAEIERRRVNELQQVLDAEKFARDSRLGFLRHSMK